MFLRLWGRFVSNLKILKVLEASLYFPWVTLSAYILFAMVVTVSLRPVQKDLTDIFFRIIKYIFPTAFLIYCYCIILLLYFKIPVKQFLNIFLIFSFMLQTAKISIYFKQIIIIWYEYNFILYYNNNLQTHKMHSYDLYKYILI